ncbi:MAG: PilN domain-containing protein [Actinobacteria bacterium]|nr:PilN domain-containing protein [Actinomycetota bacterium]
MRGAGSRSGPLPFLLVGGLALLLVGVLMLLHYSNQVSDRESNVAQLESERSEATAKAAELAPFTSFVQMAEQRTSTIAELADARFDWPRVIQQLSLILPPDVFFTSMTASSGAGEGEASAVSVPSLSLQGCASSQDAVAGFVATLKQIDGVTRVSLAKSSTAEGEGEASGASPCSASGTAQFSLLVVFDEAPPSPDGASAAPVEEAPAEGEAESSEVEAAEGSSETEGGSESGEPAAAQSATTGEGGATG